MQITMKLVQDLKDSVLVKPASGSLLRTPGFRGACPTPQSNLSGKKYHRKRTSPFRDFASPKEIRDFPCQQGQAFSFPEWLTNGSLRGLGPHSSLQGQLPSEKHKTNQQRAVAAHLHAGIIDDVPRDPALVIRPSRRYRGA